MRCLFPRAHRTAQDADSSLARGRSFLPPPECNGVGPPIMANAGDLPGDLHARLTTGDLETVVLNLLGDANGAKPPMQVSW